MELNQSTGQGTNYKDPELWQLAQKRASFKGHLATYIIINSFFWLLWTFTGSDHEEGLPWPVWPMLGWGIGLAFHYIGAYVYPKNNAVEKEYQKLREEKYKTN